MRDYSIPKGALDLAVESAELGGRILKEQFGKVADSDIEAKMAGDWVSIADKSSESAIIALFSETTPDYDILTEEKGSISRRKPSEYRWIVDPLDGTTNYLHHLPVWAVSVGLEQRDPIAGGWGTIVAGAVHIPPTGETFTAVKGEGAYRNGRRINPRTPRSFRDSLLGTGFPFRRREYLPRYLALFKEIFENCADVRRAGAVAVDLCHTAAGDLDGFWELGLSPWDIAAGSLIIAEAGGSIGDFQGGNEYLSSGDVIAGNAETYPLLVQIVRKHFPEPRSKR